MTTEREALLHDVAYFFYDALWASKLGVKTGTVRMRRIE